jgi:hypothetical protein
VLSPDSPERSVPCPKCGQPAGKQCRSERGYYYPHGHSERKDELRRVVEIEQRRPSNLEEGEAVAARILYRLRKYGKL